MAQHEEIVRLTLSANAGVALEIGGLRVLVDAVHDQTVEHCSRVTPAIWEQIKQHPAFAAPDLIAFTHCHPDHCSPAMAASLHKRWPKAVLALPEPRCPGQLLLEGTMISLRIKGTAVTFYRLPHVGGAALPHYGILIDNRAYRALFLGDYVGTGTVLQPLLRDSSIDLAVVNYLWLTLRGGRRTLREVLHPAAAAVVHLPFPADDDCGVRQQTRDLRATMDMDIRLMIDPFQTERFLVAKQSG